MSNRITKAQAAKIAGMHEKTLERHTNKIEFQEATGYLKNSLNGRVSFDETMFRQHLAGATGTEQINNTLEPAKAIVKASKTLPAAKNGQARRDLLADELFNAFLIPHKLYLTLDEAKSLTHFPKSELRKHSELKHGRRVIRRSKLEKL